MLDIKLPPQENAKLLIKYFSEWTVSVTKNITFWNAKMCANKCLEEIILNIDNEEKKEYFKEVKAELFKMQLG